VGEKGYSLKASLLADNRATRVRRGREKELFNKPDAVRGEGTCPSEGLDVLLHKRKKGNVLSVPKDPAPISERNVLGGEGERLKKGDADVGIPSKRTQKTFPP